MATSNGIAVAGMPKGNGIARSWVGRAFGPMARGSLRGSIFMFMSASIGPGALLLPHMFRMVGVPLGLLLVLFGAFAVAQSLRFIITIAHLTGCSSYPAGVAAVLGPAAGLFVCHVTNFVMVLSMGQHLNFLTGMLPRMLPAELFTMLPAQLVAVLLVYPFCALRDVSALRNIAPVAPLALLYVIVLITSRGLASPSPASPQGQLGEELEVMRFGEGGFWMMPQAWAILLNAMSVHHMAVPVYKQLHMARPHRVNKVILRASAYLSFLYGLVGASGFLAHGRATPENILLVYPAGDGRALIAQAMVGSTLMVAIPMNMHATRDQVNELLPEKVAALFKGSALGRCVQTALLMLMTVCICNCFPNITSIIGIACGFGTVIYSFAVPAVVMCVLRYRSTLRAKSACMTSSMSGACIAELLLTSPLSSPLMGHRTDKSGMVSPKWSDADLRRLDNAPGLADESDLLPEDTDMNMTIMMDEEADERRHSFESPASHHRRMPVRDARMEMDSPRASSCGAWSRLPSRLPSDVANIPSDTEWSFEFALSLFAMLLASGLGLTAAGKTFMGMIAGWPA